MPAPLITEKGAGRTDTDASDVRIREDRPEPAIARITLARPDKRNAQDRTLLYDLSAALDRAARESEVRVIVLAADGRTSPPATT